MTLTMTFPKAKLGLPSGYPLLLAVSSDSLLVIDRKDSLVESIVSGIDNQGVKLQAEDEDQFLDAIGAIKFCFLHNINPLECLDSPNPYSL